MLIERRYLRIVYAILFVFGVLNAAGLSQVGWAYNAEVITDPVSYPLPTLPEPVLLGGDLRIEVNAESDASGWTALLTSKYGSSSIDMINGSYAEGAGWTLYFEIPGTLYPALYSLNLVYSEGADSVNYTQSRCVWVLEEWPESLTIAQISDTHMPYGKDVFATYTYEANLVQPDLVVATGDIVDVETIASAWGYLQGILELMEIPSFLIPGNHDYAGANSALYQKYGGELNYTLMIGDFLFIALDSHSGGFIYLDQLRWAERVLQRHPDKVKMMGFHHPLLSSEYEDDVGTVKGGEIAGSWENIEELEDLMYFTWRDNLDEARELLRLIETYDVRLIISGHVHRDMIYILNNQHYFVTTSTTGGGLPPGSQYGSRLITIDSDGDIQLDEYAKRDLYNPPNSIPTGHIEYYYKTANDWSEAAVSAKVVNGLERQLTDAKLEFVVSTDHTVEDYQFYPSQPNRVETFTTGKGHLFVAYFDVPALSTFYLTLAATEDGDEPAIEVDVPTEYVEGMTIRGTIDVTDEGWGVREVTASYSATDGASWTYIDLPFTPQISGDTYILEYPATSYEFTIPDDVDFTELLLRVEAWDFADNHGATQTSIVKGLPPTPTYTLTVNSSPVTGVTFKLDGDTQTTPYSETLEEGTHTISVAQEMTVAGKNYSFTSWEDGITSTERTLDLNTDTTLKINYEEVTQPEETPPEPTEEEPTPKPAIPIPTVYALAGVIIGAMIVIFLNMRK